LSGFPAKAGLPQGPDYVATELVTTPTVQSHPEIPNSDLTGYNFSSWYTEDGAPVMTAVAIILLVAD
jgi:hypothetical protein